MGELIKEVASEPKPTSGSSHNKHSLTNVKTSGVTSQEEKPVGEKKDTVGSSFQIEKGTITLGADQIKPDTSDFKDDFDIFDHPKQTVIELTHLDNYWPGT